MTPRRDEARGPLRVALVEDQREIREGLRFLIDGADGYRCSGCFAAMEDALASLGPDTADLVLVDLGLPGMSGIEGIRRLKERLPDIPMLALTVYEDDERIFQALCAGASGYLLKKTPPARLLEALRDAAAGGSPVSPEVATRVIALFREFRPPAQADHDLTPHEVRILQLLTEGHSYQTAAELVRSSAHTVVFHVRSIFRKLQVHSKSEAVAKALRQRIVR